jgi:CheY-like chemotaxis protein
MHRRAFPVVKLPFAIVAEDHDDMRALMAAAVREAGYQVVEAPNGLALAMALRDEHANVDLIVCDARMPWAGGLAVLDALDRGPPPHVPAIVVTAFPDEAMRAQVQSRPSTWLLEKPFELSALRALAGRLRPS